jgi:hypothetical protein
VFRFVEQERASFPVTTLCRVLGVSPSGYWAWRTRRPSVRSVADAALSRRITAIHAQSRGTMGHRGSTPSWRRRASAAGASASPA